MKFFLTCWFSLFFFLPLTIFGTIDQEPLAEILRIDIEGDSVLCQGGSTTLIAIVDEPADSFRWSPSASILDPTLQAVEVSPVQTTEYVVTAYFGNVLSSTSIIIAVDDFEFPRIQGDTTICEGEPVILASSVSNTNTSFDWTPANGLSDSTVANPVARPSETTTYKLVAIGASGLCADSAEVTINVLPASLEIENGDTAFLCKEGSVTLTAESSTNGNDITWRPPNDLSSTSGASVVADPEITTTYIASLTTPDGCLVEDTIVVRVDSLPDSIMITAVPGPMQPCNKYCPGETVALFSPPVDLELYPEITYEWTNDAGSIVDSNYFSLNTVIETQSTTQYIRINRNNACETRDSILIEVVDPDVPINVNDTTVCAGMPVQIIVDDTDLTDLEWTSSPMGSEGFLSCTDCPDPVITPGSIGQKIGPDLPAQITFTLNASKEECCPVMTSVTVTIDQRTLPVPPAFTCPGEPVQINVPNTNLQSIEWTMPSGLNCTDCFDPIANVEQNTLFPFCAVDNEECTVAGTAAVNIFPPPDTLDIDVSSSEVAVGGDLTVILSVGPPPSSEITWTVNGVESDETGLEALLRILDEGENEIIATFLDANGCQRSIAVTVVGVEPMFEVPKAFTPNGDDFNDFFRPVVTNADEFEENFITDFIIFNRWGEKVYENDNNEEGWDGRYKDEPAPAEVYVYIIEVTLPNGDVQTFKGDVTLLR